MFSPYFNIPDNYYVLWSMENNSATDGHSSLILPVILSGGSGVRLWPVSRRSMPKQFQKIMGGETTLLQQTMQRAHNPDLFANPLIIGHAEHKFLLQDNAREIGIEPSAILLEPEAKNTAAAVTVAALWASKREYEYILVMPSDHLIKDMDIFYADVLRAFKECKISNEIVYFGIEPTHPHIGYGYLKHDEGKVTGFIEKPQLKQARALIAETNVLWNSGIFFIPTKPYLERMEFLSIDLVNHANKSIVNGKGDTSFFHLCPQSYSNIPAMSFDKAYCEKVDTGRIVNASFGWSDIGSWDSILAQSEKNDNNTFIKGNVVATQTTNSYITSEGILVGVSGMDNVVVVATKDAVLVTSNQKTQDIGALVKDLKLLGKLQVDEHFITRRSWGSFETLSQSQDTNILRMRINPKESLLMLPEPNNNKHWVVISGILGVTTDGKHQILRAGESAFADPFSEHRLENIGDVVTEFIEIKIQNITDQETAPFTLERKSV